jgi:hypothetical protein
MGAGNLSVCFALDSDCRLLLISCHITLRISGRRKRVALEKVRLHALVMKQVYLMGDC